MFRRELGEDEGMLFVMPRATDIEFCMKNTRVPLSIAFIRSDGVIANIARMEPHTLTVHRSRVPCRYALEMAQGWFAENGVREGTGIGLPQSVTATE